MKQNTTTPACILNDEKLNDLETLLALFPPADLQAFYNEFSTQMLLKTSTQVEHHEAMQELLKILCRN